MKRALISLSILSFALYASAKDSRLEAINAVKKDTAFLYAEATMASKEEAAQVACELLQGEIIRWSEEKRIPIDSITACKLSATADTMVAQRAALHRVFCYINKDRIMPLASPEKRDSSLLNEKTKETLMRKFALKKDNGVLKKILHAKNFFELREIMEPLKERGDIVDYGKYASMKNPADCYLIVYDPAGNICAWLDKGSDTRRNLKTGKEDTVKNYRGCGAIWFIIKE